MLRAARLCSSVLTWMTASSSSAWAASMTAAMVSRSSVGMSAPKVPPSSPDDLDPVGALLLPRADEGRRLFGSRQRLHRDPELRAVSPGGGGEIPGGEQVGLVAPGEALAGRPLGRRERGHRELVEHRGHPEAQRVGQRHPVGVGVGVDQTRKQGVAAAVHPGQVSGQAEPLPDSADAAILDPDVPVGPELRPVEHGDVHHREVRLRQRPAGRVRRFRHREDREHGREGGESEKRDPRIAAPGRAFRRGHVLTARRTGGTPPPPPPGRPRSARPGARGGTTRTRPDRDRSP